MPEDHHYKNIEEELFELLQNRENIIEDLFDKTVKSGIALDIEGKIEKDRFLRIVSDIISLRVVLLYINNIKKEGKLCMIFNKNIIIMNKS